jgi:MinD-like ATPase involved in chromosome partitioning or flagellar assembly
MPQTPPAPQTAPAQQTAPTPQAPLPQPPVQPTPPPAVQYPAAQPVAPQPPAPTPVPSPRPTTEPAAAADLDDLSISRRTASGERPLRKVLRTAGRMFTSGRATRELAELAAEVQAPVHTGRRIAVASVHGGAGKSTVSAVLASVFAARRADPVLVADADPYEGSLTWRLGVTAQPLERIAPDLVAARGGDLRALEPLLPRTKSGLWVLPSGGAGQPNLCSDVTRALSRLFAVAVTDCPPGLESRTTGAAVADAHSVVLVAAATPDGVRATYRALNRVMSTGYAAWLRRVVVVFSAGSPHGRAALKLDAARDLIDGFGVPVVTLPFDRHLAGGARIRPARIAEATLVAATRTAALALDRARQH